MLGLKKIQRNKIILLLQGFIVAALLFSAMACKEERPVAETYVTRKRGVEISMTAYMKSDDKNAGPACSLTTVFDGNPLTGCLFYVEYGSEVRLKFSKPVYLKGVRLIADRAALKGNMPPAGLAKHLAVGAYPGDDDIFFGGSRRYVLQDTSKPQNVILETEGFLRLLRVNSLIIEIYKPAENWSEASLWLTEIEPYFADKPTFKPTMKLADIKKSYAREDKAWSFRTKKDVSEETKEAVLMHLVYYALNGSSGAEKMLYNYAPPGAASGEWASFIHSWYDREKKLRE